MNKIKNRLILFIHAMLAYSLLNRVKDVCYMLYCLEK